MKYLKIENNGLLDIRLVALMGGTTKANNQFKIGQFGTGLKYTLAFLFRNNLDFKIFVDDKEVKIGLDREEIAGEVFEIMRINGERTSITTRMGADWEPWMIVRELWCNALDEGGAHNEIVYETKGIPGKTVFYIQIDKQIEEVLNTWDKYFIHGMEPLWENEYYAIYPTAGQVCVYKQGVLIHEDKTQKSLFRYDIKTAPINELREYRGTLSYAAYEALVNANEKVISYLMNNINTECFEKENMDWGYWTKFNQEWRKVIGNNLLVTEKILDQLQNRQAEIPENIIVVPPSLFKALTKQFEGVSLVKTTSEGASFYEDYNEEVENAIKQGLTILEAAGYYINNELEFRYGHFEDPRTLAQINRIDKTISVSVEIVKKSLHEVCAIIVEENEHYVTGYPDCSREFQTHFIKMYTRQVLRNAEIEI
jgi:hypothetical protein